MRGRKQEVGGRNQRMESRNHGMGGKKQEVGGRIRRWEVGIMGREEVVGRKGS
jgi:hypothetical protein